ncbi:hypothetical protein CMK11_18235 [Candidatus Poribacteria bacterium]|nr:hypothetical protein [Candidatus Poribacteria bacterium]
MNRMRAAAAILALVAYSASTKADTLRLLDGSVVEGCYVRDEATRLVVWTSLADVGTDRYTVYPRSGVDGYEIDRREQWDERPALPDLSVTHIEMNPKLAGLHGRVHYDTLGRPKIGGAPALVDIGDRAYDEPERVVQDLKLFYEPGEEITFTAHVKNVGFAPSRGFSYEWLIDGEEIAGGFHDRLLDETDEITFELRWAWRDGMHHVEFRVATSDDEISIENNVARDPTWGWGLVYIVHPGRVAAWREARTAYGTFSFEDFYRWHLDIMNRLFEASVYPSAPDGIRARVRLDRIIYTDDVDAAAAGGFEEDGIRYDQGRWIWIDDDDRNETWEPASHDWRNKTEWSLPHELGHQLGMVDLYQIDYAGDETHVTPDTGEAITHMMNRPYTMMHWHGPNLWSEIHAGYLNETWDKPRGYFGDYYFAIPETVVLRALDINGRPLPGAGIEAFQRGARIDPGGDIAQTDGVTIHPVLEDGDFPNEVAGAPVVAGKTDSAGEMALPNRDAAPVRSLNGYERKPNAFGNINVVGQRGLMLVKVTWQGQPVHFWIEAADLVVEWYRGNREKAVVTLKTPFAAPGAPQSPRSVTAERGEGNSVIVAWEPSRVGASREAREGLDRVVGYRVWRRVGNDGLNDRPWFPVRTVGPDVRRVIADLDDLPAELYYYSKRERFGVSTIGELGTLSAIVPAALPDTE